MAYFFLSFNWTQRSWTHENSLLIFKWITKASYKQLLFINCWRPSWVKCVDLHLWFILNHHDGSDVGRDYWFLALIKAFNYAFLEWYFIMIGLTSVNIPLCRIILTLLSHSRMSRLMLLANLICLQVVSWQVNAWEFKVVSLWSLHGLALKVLRFRQLGNKPFLKVIKETL